MGREARSTLALVATLLLAGCGYSWPGQMETTDPGRPPRHDARIELLEVSDDPARGYPRTFENGIEIRLVGTPIVTTSGIESIRLGEDPNDPAEHDRRPALFYTFTDAAAPRVQRATERLVGKQVAVTVDGEPIGVAQVDSPFGKHMMTHRLDWEEAELLLREMTGEDQP